MSKHSTESVVLELLSLLSIRQYDEFLTSRTFGMVSSKLCQPPIHLYYGLETDSKNTMLVHVLQ